MCLFTIDTASAKGILTDSPVSLDTPSIKYLEGRLVSAKGSWSIVLPLSKAVMIARTFSSSAVVNDMILYIKMLDNYTFRIRLPDKNLITLPALRITGAVTSISIVWASEVFCAGITWIVAVPVLRTVKFPCGSTYRASPE